MEQCQLEDSKMKKVRQNCFDYIKQVGQSIINCYPEDQFILVNRSFLDPKLCTEKRCDMRKLWTGLTKGGLTMMW